MATYESKRAKKCDNAKKDALATANFVLAKNGDIDTWLKDQKTATSDKITQEKVNLASRGIDAAADQNSMDVLTACYKDIEKVEGWMKNLAESVTSAQSIPPAVLAS